MDLEISNFLFFWILLKIYKFDCNLGKVICNGFFFLKILSFSQLFFKVSLRCISSCIFKGSLTIKTHTEILLFSIYGFMITLKSVINHRRNFVSIYSNNFYNLIESCIFEFKTFWHVPSLKTSCDYSFIKFQSFDQPATFIFYMK